jgi:beta-lactamase class A
MGIKNLISRPLTLLGILLVVSLLCNLVLLFQLTKTSEVNSLKEEEKKYSLLSKKILQEYPQDLLLNFFPLRQKINEEIKTYENSFAVYFEYLPTGTSIGINEEENFPSASLFKLPVAMGYYHKKDRLDIKEDPIVKIREEHIDKQFGDLWKRGVGAEVKLSEALKLALAESDNTAIKIVEPFVDQVDIDAVYAGLDIDYDRDEKGQFILTARKFSSILKALYFSSVISKESSQEILEYLTMSPFVYNLKAGIPENIKVAHKIGVYSNSIYMDCGIVYVPRRPYLLCLVSESDVQTASQRMKNVSKMIFDYISSASLN